MKIKEEDDRRPMREDQIPFGVCNAPVTFQMAWSDAFREIIWYITLPCFFPSKAFASSRGSLYLSHTAQPQIESFKERIHEVLGSLFVHVVSQDGVQTDPDKTEYVRTKVSERCPCFPRFYRVLQMVYSELVQNSKITEWSARRPNQRHKKKKDKTK